MKNLINLSLASMVFFSATLFAQDFVFDKEKGKAVPNFIGQIKLMKGKVFRKVKDETIEVATGERFKLNDIVITQDQSFVKIMMIDDSTITLGPKSEMKLSSFDFTDKNNRSMAIELIKGQLGADIKNRAKPGEINFKTKYTTMGVRGTYFLMNHQTLGNMEIDDYAVLKGSVEVIGYSKIQKGERFGVIFENSTPSVTNQRKLTEEEMKYLNPTINEDKEVKPFLPLLTLDELKNTSLKPENDQAKNQAGEVPGEKRQDQKPHWKDSLKKLNEKLKERQKTR